MAESYNYLLDLTQLKNPDAGFKLKWDEPENANKKYLVFLNEDKKEVKNEIKSLDDIFNHSETLINVVQNHENSKPKK